MKKFKITGVAAREILDCRWNPTVQVDVWVNDEILGRADVPAGTFHGGSTRQRSSATRRSGMHGMGVRKAVKNINEILGPAVIGMDVTDQRKVDEKLRAVDGSKNKSKLGANAIVGVSVAAARAASTRGPAAPLPVCQLQRPYAARTAPEPAQRRQADLQRPRFPGVLHLPHRRRDLLRVAWMIGNAVNNELRDDRHQEVRQDSGQRGRRRRVRHAHQQGPRGDGLPGPGGGPLRVRQEDRLRSSTARPRIWYNAKTKKYTLEGVKDDDGRTPRLLQEL